MDQAAFQSQLDEVLLGGISRMETSCVVETPNGRQLRQLQVAPLRIGDATYFAAISEDLTKRAQVLAELHEVSDQLLRAQEQERQRIAIELHDSTSQHLAALSLSLASLRRRTREDQGVQTLIAEMDKLVQQAVRETRVLSYLMNASERERDGLEASARRFVEGFGGRTGLRATFESAGPVDAIPPAPRHALIRVIQEALSNVYRHANATTVGVSLTNHAGWITARIADNGRGLPCPTADVGGAPLGVGIPGMRARVDQLGGVLDVANLARGTVVTARVPVARL
jgi:signal transduction histidine kinase